MTVNLIHAIQNSLGYAKLQKIDPNIQDVKPEEKSFGTNAVAQAAIPAILLGLCNYLQTQENADSLFSANNGTDYLDLVFGNQKTQVIYKIASYGASTISSTEKEMEHIILESIRIIRDTFPNIDKFKELKTFLVDQKSEVLSYLPGALQIGTVMHNNTLDDRTHKMEGPISNLMHKIENKLSS